MRFPTTTTYVDAVRNTLYNSESKIESVAKVDGGVLVKVNHASEALVCRLRELLPLSNVALAEDLTGSATSAHILFQEKNAQHKKAILLARKTCLSRVLVLTSNAFFITAVISFVAYVALNSSSLV